ncbi:MAG: hypothetical protein HKN58_09640 [Xanthomonadales bacterium]|nr:hypothetical protein [Xanthomonadales bacterium]
MSDTPPSQESLLTEIRDIQKARLALAQEQHAMAKRQFERAEALHARAERIQDRSEGIMRVARKSLFLILPIIVGLLAYLTWLIFI